MIIFIFGPGGAGKTTSGKILAKKLGYDFLDLDEKFIEDVDDIGKYISDFGYEKYCFTNSSLFYSLTKDIKNNTIFVLSSGFLAHEGLDELTKKHKTDLKKLGKTIMLLPSKDIEKCQKVVIKRQLNRRFGLRKNKEIEKFRSRFNIYKNLGDIKIFSDKKPTDIAELMKIELIKSFGAE